jgi:GntR family transcriptional regulator
MTAINPRSPVPKYHQLRDILLELIDGELEVDAPIPSERELADRHRLSRMTVRQAVDSLVAEGRLNRVAGVGTFVAEPKMDVQIRLASFSEDMRSRGMQPGTTVLGLERLPATAHVARQLEIAVGDPVVHVDRLRYADGVPMTVQSTYLPDYLVPGLAERGIDGSLHQLLRERFGLELTWGEQTIEAGTADATIASLLEIPIRSVVLRLCRRTFADNRVVEYDTASYRADRYQLWVPLAKPVTPFRNVRNLGGSQ